MLLPCLGLVGFALVVAFLPPAAFHWAFVSEFGPVGARHRGGFGAAAVLAFGLAARSRGIAPAGVRVLYLLFALGALFAALEEISYGQHFVGWQSPRWFAEQNAQHETNLHNLFGDRPGKTLRNVALVARHRSAAWCCRPRPCGSAGSSRRDGGRTISCPAAS